MFKKSLIFLLALTANVLAIANPVIKISSYVKEIPANYTKFAEPVVAVYDGSTNVTKQYNITYGFENFVEETDERNVVLVKDLNTNATIEKFYGGLTTAKAGHINVIITATSKEDGSKIIGSYPITVTPQNIDVTFYPEYSTNEEGANFINMQLLKKHVGTASDSNTDAKEYYIASSTSVLPSYKITATNNNGITDDITNNYDVAINYSGISSIQLNGNKLTYIGFGDSNNLLSKNDINKTISELCASTSNVITYTFTPKSEVAGIYNTITLNTKVKFIEKDGNKKQKMHLSLTRDMFTEDNITGNETDGFTIHVYKYGRSNIESRPTSTTEYWLPCPAFLTSDNVNLPYQFNKKGNYSDFHAYYKIVKDSTYYDDCLTWRSGYDSTIIPAGKSTGASVNFWDGLFQVSLPGKVRVAVYAVLGNGSPLINDYEKYTDENGNTVTTSDGFTAYSEPVYFDIDIMKRVPNISFEPNPNDYVFVKGDQINIPERFNAYGYIDTSSNGIEGYLKWNPDANAQKEYNSEGKEIEHFNYSFFISDRLDNKYIKMHNWPYENQPNSYHASWEEATKMSIGTPVQVNDKILVDGEYVLVTEENKADYADRKLQEGDLEHGTTYLAMKNWGNERWTIEFLATGKYVIPYKLLVYNHNGWDTGCNNPDEFTFNVIGTIDTKIDLEYTFQTATKGMGDTFEEPAAKVIAPSMNNYDITDKYNLIYSFDKTSTAASSSSQETYTQEKIDDKCYIQHYTKTTDYKDGSNNTLVHEVYKYDITTTKDDKGNETKTTTVISSTQEDKVSGCKLDDLTGNLIIGNVLGDVVIRVHADRKSLYQTTDEVYNNPDDAFYTVRVVDADNTKDAKWEVISTKNCHISSRYTIEQANGRFHFYAAGKIYGGTVYHGVPGISMTIGAPAKSADAANYWSVKEVDATDLKCCDHDGDKRVAAECNQQVTYDSETYIPSSGAFYKFTPTVNGYLTVDAEFDADNTIILVSENDKEEVKLSKDKVGDYKFYKPLLAGETYYLYNSTNGNSINLHGFAFQPAYIIDRTTTLAESLKGIEGTTFKNGLTDNLPTIVNGVNDLVSFEVQNVEGGTAADPSSYLSIGTDGKPSANKMTMDASGNIFNLVVKATVKSTDPTLGDCVNKTSEYKINVIDIPTYSVPNNLFDYDKIFAGDTVMTRNIKTDIIMTFGGWQGGEYLNKKNESCRDAWNYLSKGPADQIGNGDSYNSTIYNKTIDGFDYFASGSKNPADEKKQNILHNGKYIYGTGAKYEDGTIKTDYNTSYNTTYNLPCYGSYLKFEPNESGTVLLYLVQNGCCAYYDGKTPIDKDDNKIKWLPLYITDETGFPVTMVDNFSTISNYLPTGKDAANVGSYTRCITRCDKKVDALESACTYSDESKMYGTSFDWSNFKGTDYDRQLVIANWKPMGQRMSVVRLSDGGFVLTHKAYVRYAFHVKAGKTYFVFQDGSKPGFGGFSFVPTGYPNNSKYNLKSEENTKNMEKNIDNVLISNADTPTKSFTWMEVKTSMGQVTKLTKNIENLVVDINDRSDDSQMKERTLKANTWNGICLPFSVSSYQLKKIFGENYRLVTISGYDNNTIHLIEHANDYIEAGRPYFIMPEKNGVMHFDNVSLEGEEMLFLIDEDGDNDPIQIIDPSRFNLDLGGVFTYKGIYAKEDLPAYSYFPAKQGFYQLPYNSTMGGYRSYLRINSDSDYDTAKAIRFSIAGMDDDCEEETTTGILLADKSGNISTVEDDITIYNIKGQIVGKGADAINSVTHGVYIMNGKKYIK